MKESHQKESTKSARLEGGLRPDSRIDERRDVVDLTPPQGDRREGAMFHCPNCSQRLTERGCKLRCDRCGYFMDCSDYY